MDSIIHKCDGAFESERLTYRNFEDTDRDFLRNEIFSDPANTALAGPALFRPQSKVRRDEDMDALKKALLTVVICLRLKDTPSQPSEKGGKEVEESPVPTPIGYMCLNGKTHESVAHYRSVSIGIQLAKPYQGKGYGGEAINWLVDWAFTFAGVHRVAIGTVAFNTRAAGLYRKLGFIEEGRRREAVYFNRQWFDMIEFGMLEQEWEALRDKK